MDFSSLTCSYFVNLCVQAEQPKAVADMIVEPRHRIGAWVSRKANLTLLKSLAKAGEVEMMVQVSNVTMKKGLAVQTKESFDVLLGAVQESGKTALYGDVMKIAAKSLKEEDLTALQAQFPVPAAEGAAASS